MHTHDNTCSTLAGVAPHNSAKPLTWLRWREFDAWVNAKATPHIPVKPSRQIGLSLGAEPDKQLPLVHSCISQHAQARAFLASSPDTAHRLEFEVYRRDVRVVRRLRVSASRSAAVGGRRAEVTGFSEGSRRRLQRTASNSKVPLVSQFALTYHETRPDGATVKRHMNAWLTWLRRTVPGLSYLWILEFQTRGVPHFHVWLSIPPDLGSDFHLSMAAAWHRISGETSAEHLKVHTHAKNWIDWKMGGAGYLCKYLDKAAQKAVPDGFGWVGRFWGCTRGMLEAPDVWSAEEIRAMGTTHTHGVHTDSVSRGTVEGTENASRETLESTVRDVTATVIRTLSEYQKSKRRRFGSTGRTLVQKITSVWVTGGTAVLWRQLDYMLNGEGHLQSG